MGRRGGGNCKDKYTVQKFTMTIILMSDFVTKLMSMNTEVKWYYNKCS